MHPKYCFLLASLAAYTTAQNPTGPIDLNVTIDPNAEATGQPYPPIEDEPEDSFLVPEEAPVWEEPEPQVPAWEEPEPQAPVWEEPELQAPTWEEPEAPTWESSAENPAIPAVWPPSSVPPVWPPTVPGVAGRKTRDNAKTTLLPKVVDALTRIFKGKEVKDSSVNTKFTENGVKDNAGCQPLTLIFARGTNGAGNMGQVVGPALAESLRSRLDGQVTVQGVGYPALLLGNLKIGADGGPEMATLLEKALDQCPKTKVALVGYSQGAMVAHHAAAMLRKNNPAVAIVTFGDPLSVTPFDNFDPSDVKRFCADGDPICLNGLNFKAHSSYGEDAGEAAQFIVKAAGLESIGDEDN